MDVQFQFVLNWASVDATWNAFDAESPIIDYRWAIGNYNTLTTRGKLYKDEDYYINTLCTLKYTDSYRLIMAVKITSV